PEQVQQHGCAKACYSITSSARASSFSGMVSPSNASTSREIDAAFATIVRERPDALFVGNDPFFTTRRVQLVLLAGRHGLPAIYWAREFAEAGGLMSYGSNIVDVYRQVGVYAGTRRKLNKINENGRRNRGELRR